MSKIIALYLPQYHPIPENDEWYGKGFTEWTNLTKARPLFLGHYQPHVPADLGFYDLRLMETRREQAKLAQEYRVDAFCYWNYWFGDRKQLLKMPIWEVYKDKEITLPFCLAWANHSWEKKMWDKNGNNTLLMEQKYLGEEDYTDYFYTMLPLFKDERYFKVGEKRIFFIYNPLESEEIPLFIDLWQRLAKKEGFEGFYFIARDSACRNKEKIIKLGFDAVYDDNTFNIHHKLPIYKKIILFILREFFKMPTVFKYKDAINHMVTEDAKKRNVIPCIAPNWDHSPRSGRSAIILHDCKPKYFEKVLKMAMEAISHKEKEEQLILIKSWNEWGEGNHLEPDLKYGKGYLEAIKNVKEMFGE